MLRPSVTNVDPRIRLNYLINKAEDLPQLPVVAMQIFNACSDPEVLPEEIGKLVKSDPSFVSKLLRLVNSPYFGYAKHVETIMQVVNILGINGIKKIAMVSSINEIFADEGADLMWSHSIEASVAAQELFTYHKKTLSETNFLVCLLHNIARSVFNRHFLSLYEPLVESTYYDYILEREEMIFGMNHRELGAILAEKWHLPEQIIEGIRGKRDFVGDDHLLELAIKLTYFRESEIENHPELRKYASLKKTIVNKTDMQISAIMSHP